MEHNTDRILWTVLILAIGVALYVIFRPAMASQTQAVVHTISNLNGVDSSSNSDFTYSLPNMNDDTISITGYKGHAENLIIPQYRKIGSVDYKVTGIGNHAFDGNTSIEQVIIPDSVKSIGFYAFANDFNLKSLTLGSGLTSIATGTFENDTALTSVDIPASVTSIGNFAFENDWALTSVDIPASVTSIGNGVFENDKALTSVDIPASVTSISNGAFDNTSLSTISFKSPVDLGAMAFHRTNLTNVTLLKGSTYVTDSNNSTFASNVTVTIK